MGAVKCVHRLAGVIDEDYRGEWLVRLVNHGNKPVRINVGDKIVQGIYQEYAIANCPVVATLPETARGIGGFGSTDNTAGPKPPYIVEGFKIDSCGVLSSGTPAPQTAIELGMMTRAISYLRPSSRILIVPFMLTSQQS